MLVHSGALFPSQISLPRSDWLSLWLLSFKALFSSHTSFLGCLLVSFLEVGLKVLLHAGPRWVSPGPPNLVRRYDKIFTFLELVSGHHSPSAFLSSELS